MNPEEPITAAVPPTGVTVRLSADAPEAEIVLGVRLAADGKHMIVSMSARPAQGGEALNGEASKVRSLTSRQREVLALLVAGRRDREMAEALEISVQTVRTHVKHVYRKLGVRSRKELWGLER